jgi:hypothetical protein
VPISQPTRVKLRGVSTYGESKIPIIQPTCGSRYQIRRCGRATFLRRGMERARGWHVMSSSHRKLQVKHKVAFREAKECAFAKRRMPTHRNLTLNHARPWTSGAGAFPLGVRFEQKLLWTRVGTEPNQIRCQCASNALTRGIVKSGPALTSDFFRQRLGSSRPLEPPPRWEFAATVGAVAGRQRAFRRSRRSASANRTRQKACRFLSGRAYPREPAVSCPDCSNSRR